MSTRGHTVNGDSNRTPDRSRGARRRGGEIASGRVDGAGARADAVTVVGNRLEGANQFRRVHYMRRAQMLSKWFAQVAENLADETISLKGLVVIAGEVDRAEKALFHGRSDVETRSLLLVDCVIAGHEVLARVPQPIWVDVTIVALRQAMGRLSMVRSDLASKVDPNLMLVAIKAWNNSGRRADVKKWGAINDLARSMGIGVRAPDQIRKDRIRLLKRGG